MTHDIDEITLRNYPKVIFFWPIAISSALLGLFAQFIPILNPDIFQQLLINMNFKIDGRIILAIIWFAIFTCNLFVVSFDYSSAKVLAIVALIVALVLAVILLMSYIPELGAGIGAGFSINTIPIMMSFWFYYIIAMLFGLVYAFIWIEKRWDYYKITSQDITHKQGIFGDVERFPAPNVHIQKRIADVFEFLLLRSGELTIIPAARTTIIHLPNVLNINDKEKHIRELLGTLEVEMDTEV